MITALLLAAAAASPQVGDLKTFGDWTVGCDNARRCQANALVPDSDDRDAYLLLVLRRDAGGAATATLSIPLDPATAPRASLAVDGKPLASVVARSADDAATIPIDRALATALADGKTVTLVADGKALTHASLAGLAAAMLYIDDQQARIGTVGALRRAGSTPDSSVPPPPALPVVTSPAPTSAAPRTLATAAAAKLIGRDATVCEDAQPLAPEAHRLDAAHTLVLVPHPCGGGAYNGTTSVYVVDQSGRATDAEFDTSTGMSDEAGNELTNAGWDSKTRRLSEYVKARGLGDCGGTSDFVWDGARFRSVKATAMGECRGSIDWITTWRARVVTR